MSLPEFTACTPADVEAHGRKLFPLMNKDEVTNFSDEDACQALLRFTRMFGDEALYHRVKSVINKSDHF